MNPILPREHFVPDAEARVMPDGRLYLYGSYDISGKKTYCSEVLHVFSTKDMIHWTDHGVCFRSCDVPWAEEGAELYAPDCIYRDGKYYLYFCMRGNIEGVAVSDHPWGPFKDPVPIYGADRDGIDPAVFIDDDGQAYYYWGQFHLRGAKLNSDMRTLDLSSIRRNLIDEKRHGFHEGSSMRKRNGLYYLVYTDISRGRPTCLGYAVSESPLGPFTYKGILIDNKGCDPQTWNNHGSIAEFKNQWYVFYHRSSQNSECNRRMCVEPISFDTDGTIREVLPTTQGSGEALSPVMGIDAANACRMGGWEVDAYIGPDLKAPGEEILTGVCKEGWAAYRNVKFTEELSQVALLAEIEGRGVAEIWAGDEMLGAVYMESSGQERQFFTGKIRSVAGVYPLYLEWKLQPGSKAAFKQIKFYNSEENEVQKVEKTEFRKRMEQVAAASISPEEKAELDRLMRNGLQKNEQTGLPYFTGYDYATLYDWDQYFEGIVQLYMGWGTQYLRNAVRIFLEYQEENGFTKRAINNSPIAGIASEEDHEMVKPFLSQITLLCLKYDGELSWVDDKIYERLKKSLDYWLYERDPNHNQLSRWRSSIETGMDDQHERGGIWRMDYDEGVDLNSYLCRECLAYAIICENRGENKRAEEYRAIAEQRKTAVLTMWDEEDGFFYDRDERDDSVTKVKSVSGLLPLWVQLVSEAQAKRMVEEHILNPQEFWRGYPVPALAATEPGYSPVHIPGDIGCNWRANTWIPTNYMVTHGMKKYGYDKEAYALAESSRELVRKSGNREYYVTESGEGDGLKLFWGWTLLAYFMEQEIKQDFDPTRIEYER